MNPVVRTIPTDPELFKLVDDLMQEWAATDKTFTNYDLRQELKARYPNVEIDTDASRITTMMVWYANNTGRPFDGYEFEMRAAADGNAATHWFRPLPQAVQPPVVAKPQNRVASFIGSFFHIARSDDEV